MSCLSVALQALPTVRSAVLIDSWSSLVQGGVGADGGQLVSCLSVALWALPTVRSAVMDLQVSPLLTP